MILVQGGAWPGDLPLCGTSRPHTSLSFLAPHFPLWQSQPLSDTLATYSQSLRNPRCCPSRISFHFFCHDGAGAVGAVGAVGTGPCQRPWSPSKPGGRGRGSPLLRNPTAFFVPTGSYEAPAPTFTTFQTMDLTRRRCQSLGLLQEPRLQTVKAERPSSRTLAVSGNVGEGVNPLICSHPPQE